MRAPAGGADGLSRRRPYSPGDPGLEPLRADTARSPREQTDDGPAEAAGPIDDLRRLFAHQGAHDALGQATIPRKSPPDPDTARYARCMHARTHAFTTMWTEITGRQTPRADGGNRGPHALHEAGTRVTHAALPIMGTGERAPGAPNARCRPPSPTPNALREHSESVSRALREHAGSTSIAVAKLPAQPVQLRGPNAPGTRAR